MKSNRSLKHPEEATKNLQDSTALSYLIDDMVVRGLLVLPAVLLIGFLFGGTKALVSIFVGMVAILINFKLSGYILIWASKSSLSLIASMVVGGFLIRLAMIAALMWSVRNANQISLTLLGIVLIVTHLGLVFWEMRYVSLTVAYPGLKPRAAIDLVARYKKRRHSSART